MPASRPGARGLLLGVVLLMLPLAWACGSYPDTQTGEQDAAKEIVDTATKLAEKQQRAIGRAWAMGQVATAWAAIDPTAARPAGAESIRGGGGGGEGGGGGH